MARQNPNTQASDGKNCDKWKGIVMGNKVEWLEKRCYICGRLYKYTVNYEPATCSEFSCVHAHIHPELQKSNKRIINSDASDKQTDKSGGH